MQSPQPLSPQRLPPNSRHAAHLTRSVDLGDAGRAVVHGREVLVQGREVQGRDAIQEMLLMGVDAGYVEGEAGGPGASGAALLKGLRAVRACVSAPNNNAILFRYIQCLFAWLLVSISVERGAGGPASGAAPLN